MTGLGKLKVLLVDDNQHMRAIVLSILFGLGVKTIKETGDGEEAVTIFHDWAPEIVIIDYVMSPLNGVEFTRRVRNRAESKNVFVPIIMMTGHSEKSRVIEARDAGVTEFVAKPITARAIADRIRSVIYQPRSYARSGNYFGPDRRRRIQKEFAGPLMRASDLEISRCEPEEDLAPAE